MKTWEIARDMYYGKYKDGDIFQSADIGYMIIAQSELLYMDNYSVVSIMIQDESEWEYLTTKEEL